MSYRPKQGINVINKESVRRCKSRLLSAFLPILILSGCAGVPDYLDNKVERLCGYGNMLLVASSPAAAEPSAAIFTGLLKRSGIDPVDSKKILQRTDRFAVSFHDSGLRIAMQGNFPRLALKLSGAEKEEGAVKVHSPYNDIILVSIGDHHWIEEALSDKQNKEELPDIGELRPGAFRFISYSPEMITSYDDTGAVLRFLENNTLVSIDGSALPDPETSTMQLNMRFRCGNEQEAKRLSSSLRTLFFKLRRPGLVRSPARLEMSKISEQIIRERAMKTSSALLLLGPLSLEAGSITELIWGFKEGK